jgi:hypothetical protein
MHPLQSSRDLDRSAAVAAVSARRWDAIRAALADALGEEVDDNYFVEDELLAE